MDEDGKRFVDLDPQLPQFAGAQANSQKPTKVEGWVQFIDKEMANLQGVNDYGVHKDYIGFKERILTKCKPEDLLQLPSNFTQDDIVNQYRKFAILVHPDRNPDRQIEATALFKILFESCKLCSKDSCLQI